MWKYRKLDNRNASTLSQVMQLAHNKSSIKFVIYNLEDDRVELTTSMNSHSVEFFKLGKCELESIVHDSEKAKEEARKMGMRIPECDDEYAMLAYDVDSSTVFLIQSAPDINGISGVLMCMVSELINTNVRSNNNVSLNASQDKHYGFTASDNNMDLYRKSMENTIDAEAKAYASMMAKRKFEQENVVRFNVQPTNYGEEIPTPSVGVVGLNNTKRKVGIVLIIKYYYL